MVHFEQANSSWVLFECPFDIPFAPTDLIKMLNQLLKKPVVHGGI